MPIIIAPSIGTIPGSRPVLGAGANGQDALALMGVDIICEPDLDPQFRLHGGLANLGEALARRLETPRGGLFYDDNYGTDIRGALNDSMTQAQITGLQQSVEAECEKDPRVQSATAQVIYSSQTSTLTVNISIQTAAGPFALVLAVSAVTVQMLTVLPGN